MVRYQLSAAAGRPRRHFGLDARTIRRRSSKHYEALIVTVLRDIATKPAGADSIEFGAWQRSSLLAPASEPGAGTHGSRHRAPAQTFSDLTESGLVVIGLALHDPWNWRSIWRLRRPGNRPRHPWNFVYHCFQTVYQGTIDCSRPEAVPWRRY